jgi:hypothetical protein
MIDDFVLFDKAITVNDGDSHLILLVVANGHIDCVLFLKNESTVTSYII